MHFTITRGAGDNKLVISDKGQKHTFILSTMKENSGQHWPLTEKDPETDKRRIKAEKVVFEGKSLGPILPPSLREMVVDSWAIANGFEPIYSK